MATEGCFGCRYSEDPQIRQLAQLLDECTDYTTRLTAMQAPEKRAAVRWLVEIGFELAKNGKTLDGEVVERYA